MIFLWKSVKRQPSWFQNGCRSVVFAFATPLYQVMSIISNVRFIRNFLGKGSSIYSSDLYLMRFNEKITVTWLDPSVYSNRQDWDWKERFISGFLDWFLCDAHLSNILYIKYLLFCYSCISLYNATHLSKVKLYFG